VEETSFFEGDSLLSQIPKVNLRGEKIIFFLEFVPLRIGLYPALRFSFLSLLLVPSFYLLLPPLPSFSLTRHGRIWSIAFFQICITNSTFISESSGGETTARGAEAAPGLSDTPGSRKIFTIFAARWTGLWLTAHAPLKIKINKNKIKIEIGNSTVNFSG
jgi:hypothetical protein